MNEREKKKKITTMTTTTAATTTAAATKQSSENVRFQCTMHFDCSAFRHHISTIIFRSTLTFDKCLKTEIHCLFRGPFRSTSYISSLPLSLTHALTFNIYVSLRSFTVSVVVVFFLFIFFFF